MTVVFQLPSAQHFDQEVLATGCSPLAEASFSLRVLANPRAYRAHSGWIRSCRFLPRDLRSELRQLTPLFAHVLPGFLTATTPASADYAEELVRAASTPAGVAAAEVATVLTKWSSIEERDGRLRTGTTGKDPKAISDLCARGNGLRAAWIADPQGALQRLLEFMDRYWSAAFQSEWTRLTPLLLAETAACRSRLRGGLQLGPATAIRLNGNSITIERRCRSTEFVHLANERITLAPSAFLWPRLSVESSTPWPFAVFYPFPGSPRRPAAEDPLLPGLRALADGTRLAIIRLIKEQPRSTQELAELIPMSEAAVSQHLRQLRAAGLVTTNREGHYVLYSLAQTALRRVSTALAELMRG